MNLELFWLAMKVIIGGTVIASFVVLVIVSLLLGL